MLGCWECGSGIIHLPLKHAQFTSESTYEWYPSTQALRSKLDFGKSFHMSLRAAKSTRAFCTPEGWCGPVGCEAPSRPVQPWGNDLHCDTPCRNRAEQQAVNRRTDTVTKQKLAGGRMGEVDSKRWGAWETCWRAVLEQQAPGPCGQQANKGRTRADR